MTRSEASERAAEAREAADVERRQALLAWAQATSAYIVEDDYDSEIIYDRPPIAALAALDHHEHVIYVGSFSKAIGAPCQSM